MESGNELNISIQENVPGWITMDQEDSAAFVSIAARIASQMLKETFDSSSEV